MEKPKKKKLIAAIVGLFSAVLALFGKQMLTGDSSGVAETTTSQQPDTIVVEGTSRNGGGRN
ncbi:MAG: hypothetical protein IJR95_08765 [Lachnospiraceae bacterium]|nr:hypothetical protein [Lachnospiraceae bacterium]